jgi:hypothetical protein
MDADDADKRELRINRRWTQTTQIGAKGEDREMALSRAPFSPDKRELRINRR